MLFSNENEILSKAEEILESKEISKEELLDKYEYLTKQYKKLLKSTIKITQIGDKNQKKLSQANEQIEKQKQELYTLSITDKLTKIYNRAYLVDAISKEFNKIKRDSNYVVGCIIIDIDHFKKINDTYGHQTGDFVLIKTAEVIKDSIRTVDIVGRYGGEEFLVILPDTDGGSSGIIGERIREKVEGAKYLIDGINISVTISLGVTDTAVAKPQNMEKLISNADQALYEAKRTGRNKVTLFKG